MKSYPCRFFDVVDYEALENQLLLEHIDNVGKSMTLIDR